MPTGDVADLRLFCICGQKMKISAQMFGRSGKCISCKQKIRVPHPDELPEDCTDVYLKDFPQFLRRAKRPPIEPDTPTDETPPELRLDKRPPDAEDEENMVDLGKGEERADSVALDALDMLRTICSLDQRTRQRLAHLDEDEEATEKDRRRVTRRLKKVENVRAALDEELRQRLMEVAIELTTTQEKISEAGLAVRVGELEYGAFQDRATRLRRRREMLEWRQQNLRGWLAVRTAREAGGFVGARVADLPNEASLRISFPREPAESISMLDWHVEELRNALEQRREAEQLAAEADRNGQESDEADRVRLAQRKGAVTERKRADAAALFHRTRLDQIRADYANDMQAIDAQLTRARGQLQIHEISQAKFGELESTLIKAKTDLSRANRVLAKALSANTSGEVPNPRGTFLDRLAGSDENGKDKDPWLAWTAGLLLLACVVLPLAGGLSPLSALGQQDALLGVLVWLVGGAMILCACALIPNTLGRALAYSGIWLVLILAGASFAHGLASAGGEWGNQVQATGPWWRALGAQVFLVALLILAAATALAAHALKSARIVAAIVGVLGILSGVGILTDFAGALSPQPVLQVLPGAASADQDGTHERLIVITNEGNRPLWLAATDDRPYTYTYFLEKQIGSDSWDDVSVPQDLSVGGRDVGTDGISMPELRVEPGQSATFHYVLGPGAYQVELEAREGGPTIREAFTLIGPTIPDEAGDSADTLEEDDAPYTPVWQAPPTTVILRATLSAANTEPRFIIEVRYPDGMTRERTVSRGDDVLEGWRVDAYNASDRTVTLSDGRRMLILRRRQPVDVPASE
jgi:hypothetical protein